MSFDIRTTKPSNNKFYIRDDEGGYSWCIKGNPTDASANVLSNCVGYACGRFNEIIGSMKYPALNCNAEDFIDRAKSWYPNIEIITDVNAGQPGDLICWEGKGSLAGHVAIIEKRNGAGNYYTSESAWGGTAFFNATRTNSNGRLGMSSNYSFNGFLRHPEFHVDPEPTPEPTPTPEPSGDFDKYTIVKGDTLSGIAKKFNTTVSYLMEINPSITDANKINAGATINVPKQETPEPTPTPSTGLKVGDNVKITGTGNANTYGTGRTSYGIGWTREILEVRAGNKCPYRIGNSTGSTGWYPESSLQKV